MKTPRKEIEGFKFDCLKWDEAHLQLRVMLSPSDAEELCKKTRSDMYLNKELREWFYDQLTDTLNKAVLQVKERTSGSNNT
jgi:hypothetical protein